MKQGLKLQREQDAEKQAQTTDRTTLNRTNSNSPDIKRNIMDSGKNSKPVLQGRVGSNTRIEDQREYKGGHSQWVNEDKPKADLYW